MPANRTVAEAQSAKADFVPFQRRVSNPSDPTRRFPTRRPPGRSWRVNPPTRSG